MIEFLEKQKGLRLIPPSYNQMIILETTFRNEVIATGRLTSKGFILFKNSFVRKKTTYKDNPGIIEIREQLLNDNYLIQSNNPNYYILTEDLMLSSSSTASRFVHGNGRNGDKDWKYLDKNIHELLNTSY